MRKIEAVKFAIFHSCLNAGAVAVGIELSEMNDLVNGVVNGISGGTFLYVCMIEKINKNFKDREELVTKIALILGGLSFSCLLMS